MYKPFKFLTNNIYVLLVLSVLLVIASAFITYYNTREKKQSTQTVIRRYQSIGSSIQLLSLLKDMETGQRGYIITGDSEFLEPYNTAKSKIKEETDSLNKLINDNEPQMNLLEGRILTAIHNKSTDLESSINIVNTFGRDSAARRVDTKIGKAHMDTLRILVQDLIQRERTLLSQQNQKLDRNTRLEDTIRFFAFTLIGLTSMMALIMLIQKQRSINELIDSLKKSNEELEQRVKDRTKQLVEANHAKDHFLGIASHDLKVPISGVLGLIELMNLENKNRPEKEAEYLSYMQDSCNNMQRLISNLLDINRIERGATNIKKQDVNLKRLLTKLEREFSHQAKKKNIELVINSIDEVISTDMDALSRILENLLSNAIKFSAGDSRIHLRTANIGDSIKFEIIDQGPGIPSEDIPKLFDKFQKLTNQPTGGEGSTGLGLSIVKELTILLGGEITVTSKVGEGTIFTVVIIAK